MILHFDEKKNSVKLWRDKVSDTYCAAPYGCFFSNILGETIADSTSFLAFLAFSNESIQVWEKIYHVQKPIYVFIFS